MVELDAIFVRNVWTFYIQNATSTNASDYGSSGWRSPAVEFSFEGFGWHTTPATLLFRGTSSSFPASQPS